MFQGFFILLPIKYTSGSTIVMVQGYLYFLISPINWLKSIFFFFRYEFPGQVKDLCFRKVLLVHRILKPEDN